MTRLYHLHRVLLFCAGIAGLTGKAMYLIYLVTWVFYSMFCTHRLLTPLDKKNIVESWLAQKHYSITCTFLPLLIILGLALPLLYLLVK